MAIVDLFSKRQKRTRGEVDDVFTYDTVPPALRVQVVSIWDEALGQAHKIYSSSASENGVYSELNKIAANEFGMERLGNAEGVKQIV